MPSRWTMAIAWCLGFHAVGLFASVSIATAGDTLRFDNDVDSLHVVGSDARLQLVISRFEESGNENASIRDVTHSAQVRAKPLGIVEISSTGQVIPIGDGTVTITATPPSVGDEPQVECEPATIQLTVSGVGSEPPLSFPHRIVPIFTKLGCNSGGCHGKAAGQNGFKLSLLGFEPREDYEHLIGESRSRRVSPAVPDHSLLLTKAINASPHGGGQRLEIDTDEYRQLRRWISQGMPYGEDSGHQVVAIRVIPGVRRLAAMSTQQLAVIATRKDGTTEDVTSAAVFESNDTAMADVSTDGLVQIHDAVGDVSIMARYQGHVTVFTADVPRVTETPLVFPEPTNVVDTYVFAKLQSLGIPPSSACDDATFLRRACLDIAGRLPTLDEVTSFETDSSPDKRTALVDRLLDTPEYADYFAGRWNTILRNRRSRGPLQFSTLAFYDWIRESFANNRPYNEFVSRILSASGTVASNPPVAWYQQVPDTNQRVEDAAQLFMGQRIQCARCHHHPYEKWSQADYAQLAAFFTTVTKKADRDPIEQAMFTRVGGASSPHPKTGQTLTPAGLDAENATIRADEDPRVALSDWMTDPANPFFARTVVNRYWKHFLGRGLVEPEDDMRMTNPPSNPSLLDALAADFVASGYDLKQLIRTITMSQMYSFSGDANYDNLLDRRSYSRFYPKRLAAEVLLDAVDDVTHSRTAFAGMPTGTRAVSLPDTNFDSYFLQVFGRPESTTACECERSQDANLAQSLHLLNSEQMQSKLAEDSGRAAMLAADESRSDADKVTELYRMSLSRSPNEIELKTMLTYLGSKPNRREAFEDLIWSLLNSKEFLFNH